MSKLRVNGFSISLDGYGAGPGQDLDHGLGRGGETLHEWMVATRTFKQLVGKEGGATGVDDDFTVRSFENLGAWIMGRNMFGPVRGPWPDESWRGWWGDNPPYHVPVFVLTHHARAPVAMEGGTVFHFVTDGIESALEPRAQGGGGKGHPARRRGRNDPRISQRRAPRRDAPCGVAGVARIRGESVCGDRSARTRL